MAKELHFLQDEEQDALPKERTLVDMLDDLQRHVQEKPEDPEKWQLVKHVIEALLFASADPLSLRKIREVADTIHPFKPRHLLRMIEELKEQYQKSTGALVLEEVAGGYAICTKAEYGQYVNLLHRNKRLEKLSTAATEVLAIIAYRQPVTRAQVEKIRGVDCTGIMQTVLERGLIEVVGRMEAPGRPSLYAVTAQFLKYFGLKSLSELPERLAGKQTA